MCSQRYQRLRIGGRRFHIEDKHAASDFLYKAYGTLRDVFLPARVADGRHEVLEILFVLQTTVIENIVPNLAP